MNPETDQTLLEETPVLAPPRLLSRLLSLTLLAGLAVVVVIVGIQLAARNAEPFRVGQAPDFTINLYEGGEFTLSEHRGKIIVVNFWGSWCAPCRDEAPDLQAAHDRYADDGVIVVGVGFRDTERAARQFIEELGLTYPNGNDDQLRITARYNVTGAPETYIIDRDGNYAEFYIGQFPSTWLDETLQAMIAAES